MIVGHGRHKSLQTIAVMFSLVLQLLFKHLIVGSSYFVYCLLFVCVLISLSLYIYIYTYVGRDRERDREMYTLCMYVYIYICIAVYIIHYIYIYIYIYTHTHATHWRPATLQAEEVSAGEPRAE